MIQHNWWGLQARTRHEDLRREAHAAKLAAAVGRDAGLRQRLGRALMRLGAAIAQAETLPPMPGPVNED